MFRTDSKKFYNLFRHTNTNVNKEEIDILIWDNEEGTCMIIDVAILADGNVIKKEAEKILKYKDFII
jgi:hypothetical protein